MSSPQFYKAQFYEAQYEAEALSQRPRPPQRVLAGRAQVPSGLSPARRQRAFPQTN